MTYRKFIIDNFDTSVNESAMMLDLNLTIDTDGTASLENKQQKIYNDKDLSDEMNRVLKKIAQVQFCNPKRNSGEIFCEIFCKNYFFQN